MQTDLLFKFGRISRGTMSIHAKERAVNFTASLQSLFYSSRYSLSALGLVHLSLNLTAAGLSVNVNIYGIQTFYHGLCIMESELQG